jgi:PII-like signaling protein
MRTETAGKQLRIYVNSTDHLHGIPLYSAIVRKCQAMGLAGATVFRCAEGFGGHHELHTIRFLSLSDNLPVCIEVIDLPERVEPFLAELDGMIGSGLVTISDVRIVRYRE